MSDKRVVVLIGAVMLGGCLAPVVPPDDRAAVCQIAPAAEICRTGRAWPWDPKRYAAHDVQVQLAAHEAAETQAREDKAARDAEAQREAAAQKAAAEAALAESRRRRAAKPRYAHRRTETFDSFADALDVLEPEGSPAPFDLAVHPGAALMGAKGRVIMLDMKVMQVVDKDNLLANPCFMLQGVEDMGGSSVCPVLVRLTRGCGGDRDMIDDMRFSGIVEVEGTAQYETAMGVQKTVPQLVAYGVQAAR